MISLDDLTRLTSLLYELGYDDVAWSESLSLPTNEDDFALELVFVIVNSGMRFTTARGIFERIKAALLRGASRHRIRPSRESRRHRPTLARSRNVLSTLPHRDGQDSIPRTPYLEVK